MPERRARRTGETPGEGWIWRGLALPGTIWLLTFLVAPLYVVLAILFGTIDPILRRPGPFRNPIDLCEQCRHTLVAIVLDHRFTQQPVQRPLDDRSLAQAGGLGQAFNLAEHYGVGDLKCHGEILAVFICALSIYIDDLDEARHEMGLGVDGSA